MVDDKSGLLAEFLTKHGMGWAALHVSILENGRAHCNHNLAECYYQKDTKTYSCMACVVCGRRFANTGRYEPSSGALPEHDPKVGERWGSLIAAFALEIEALDTKQKRSRWMSSYTDYLKSDAWNSQRRRVLQRDGHTCKGCGASGTTLHVHHLTYETFKKHGKSLDFELVTLCQGCHKLLHDEMK